MNIQLPPEVLYKIGLAFEQDDEEAMRDMWGDAAIDWLNQAEENPEYQQWVARSLDLTTAAGPPQSGVPKPTGATMSTAFRFEPALSLAEFRAGLPRLEAFGIRAVDVPQSGGGIATMLTDGKNYIEFYTGDETDVGLERWGGNDARGFIDPLGEVFERIVLSEHDDRYWDGMEAEEDETE